MRRIFKFALVAIAITLSLLAVPSFWAFFMWLGFPQSSIARAEYIQSDYVFGRDCGESRRSASVVTSKEAKACFTDATRVDLYLLGVDRSGLESLTLAYKCENDALAGEMIMTFYATLDVYTCSYTMASTWNEIDRYEVGDIAGFSPSPSALTKGLIEATKMAFPRWIEKRWQLPQ